MTDEQSESHRKQTSLMQRIGGGQAVAIGRGRSMRTNQNSWEKVYDDINNLLVWIGQIMEEALDETLGIKLGHKKKRRWW